jgi:hypothetical protein
MEGGRVQEEEENRKEEAGEDGRHSWGRNEERGDRGYTGQNHRCAETEYCHGHNKEHPRTSAVIVTLSEGARMSYADVLAMARQRILLTEIGVEPVEMSKAMIDTINIRVPEDKGRGNAS